jgi:UDP-N-acetylmuramate dehydrogenase
MVREALEKINASALSPRHPLMGRTSFRVGGPAELLFAPSSAYELSLALEARAEYGCPLFILGGGANILVGDKGVPGLTIDTSKLSWIRREGNDVIAGAGASVGDLCRFALVEGLTGLEFLYGMPGSVGGAVYMNARCYEREIADVLVSARLLGEGGERIEALDPSKWAYKKSPYQDSRDSIIEARFHLGPGDREEIRDAMESRRADREAKGHYRLPSAGSVFKNDRAFGAPTGKIIDELGLRGRERGAAMVAPWHGNIVVNAGGASAADIRALIEEVAAIVLERRGFALEREVIYVGEF